SDKAEYAARTIRPKLHRVLADFLMPLSTRVVKKSSLHLSFPGLDALDVQDPETLVHTLSLDKSVLAVSRFFPGGTRHAKNRFQAFLAERLEKYDQHSNQPQTDDISHMGPYLHFGQISPLYLAMALMNAPASLADARDAFLEQLIIRRELAVNFVNYTPGYDTFDVIPGWAKKTLADHETDPREHIYTLHQLAQADTHDPYWNAAMKEMTCTGFMHNYMRMYWGKKILEWSSTPKQAYETTLALNNRYFLDGRDPNSYTGVAWLYGVHDRAWAERSIFGKVRYMAASGLERKCDISAYVDKVTTVCS
ncbi:MAG: deoxyribodipyrimidine photolyase, partial [Desulfotignum sp.]